MEPGSGDPRITVALAHLAMFRQSEVSETTLDLYAARLTADGCDPVDVATACERLERQERREGETAFPSLGVLVRLVAGARMQRGRKLRGDEPTVACPQCLDEPAGWICLECSGVTCERTESHLPHPFAVRCPHWLQQHADAIRLTAEQAMQKGQPVSKTYRDLSDLMAGRYLWRDAVTINADKARQAERRSA